MECRNYGQSELSRLAIDAYDSESVLGAKPKVWVQITRTVRVKKCLAKNCSEQDSQSHIFSCPHLDSENSISGTTINYSDIFSNNVIKQAAVMNILMSRYSVRTQLSSQQGLGEDPMDPGPS